MLESIILAVVVAVVVGLICILIGRLIESAGPSVPLLATLGGFLSQYAWVIGLLAGLLFFFGGGSFLGIHR